MKIAPCIFFPLFWIVFCKIHAQTAVFKENTKWGIKENGTVIVKPVYDTAFNYNVSNKVCLVCYKTMTASANKFIKAFTKIYLCNYLNREGKRLIIHTSAKDTCSVFTLGKHTVNQFSDNPSFFVVSAKTKKHLVDQDFKQITFKGYHEILYTPEPNFIIAQVVDEANTASSGLLNLKEELLMPFQYSDIKINSNDSLIVGCSAGIRANAEDDVFNYQGKKLAGYWKHVDMATKNFIIHKIFEPKEYYTTYKIATKEEKTLNADEVRFYNHDEILVRIKNDWYLYNLVTGEKKPHR